MFVSAQICNSCQRSGEEEGEGSRRGISHGNTLAMHAARYPFRRCCLANGPVPTHLRLRVCHTGLDVINHYALKDVSIHC